MAKHNGRNKTMKWKITEKKYKKLRNLTLLTCLLGIIIYILLIKHTMTINPAAFTYNPMLENNHWQDLENTLWWIVGIGFIIVAILFYRQTKKNPKHWFNKFTEPEQEEQEEMKLMKPEELMKYIEEEEESKL